MEGIDLILRIASLQERIRLHRLSCLPQGFFIQVLGLNEESLFRAPRQPGHAVPNPVVNALEQISVLCQQPLHRRLVGEQMLLGILGHQLPPGPFIRKVLSDSGVVRLDTGQHSLHVDAPLSADVIHHLLRKLFVQTPVFHVVCQLMHQHAAHRVFRFRVYGYDAVCISSLRVGQRADFQCSAESLCDVPGLVKLPLPFRPQERIALRRPAFCRTIVLDNLLLFVYNVLRKLGIGYSVFRRCRGPVRCRFGAFFFGIQRVPVFIQCFM